MTLRFKLPFLMLILLVWSPLTFGQNVEEDRESTVTAYFGTVFDNFVPAEQRTYLNNNLKNISGETDVRELFGFDVSWRLLGKQTSNHQLWFFLETLHGVRSADIDCSTKNGQPLDPNNRDERIPILCYEGANGDVGNIANAGTRARYVLKNATSFEGFGGFRYEFLRLQDRSVSLYVKGQLGFMAISKGPGDFLDNHFIGLGLISTNGPLAGSYFDAGYGRTDLYENKRLDRWKYDAYVTFKLFNSEKLKWIRPFAQVTVDSDFGGGADSIQSYLGLNFDIGHLWATP